MADITEPRGKSEGGYFIPIEPGTDERVEWSERRYSEATAKGSV